MNYREPICDCCKFYDLDFDEKGRVIRGDIRG